MSNHFKYLGSIVQKDEKINSDVNHRIQADWLKWKSATGVLCDRNIPLWLKRKFYRIAIRPALFYDTKCWVIKRYYAQKMSVEEIVGCLKITENKSSKSGIQTPDAGLVIAISAAPRREG